MISPYVPAVTVIDESSQTLFLTEMFRGLNLTLKAFFDRKVTVSTACNICCTYAVAAHMLSPYQTSHALFRSIILLRRDQSARGSEESMSCVDTLVVKSGV